jgi:hypothetical protein
MKSIKLDLQMGTSSANAIRASRPKVLHQQAGYKTAALPHYLEHAEVTCDPGGAHIRRSLSKRLLCFRLKNMEFVLCQR